MRRRVTLAVAMTFFLLAADAGPDPCCSGLHVLILGDSLVGEGSGLEMGLRKRFKEQGAYVTTKAGVGARAGSWAKDDGLEMFLAESRVDVVVVALGLNSSRTPPKTYGKHIRSLAFRLRDKECYWIGPPFLVDGTGEFMKSMRTSIEKNSHCRYYSTMDLVAFPKGSVSGFHVRRWKGKRWAAKVWEWMQQQEGDNNVE